MKKIVSLVLTVIMLFSVLPISTFAADLNAVKITVDSADATAGDTVNVNVRLANNPGIVSANINVAFDEGLTLVGASNGEVFPASMSFIPPKQLSTVGKITGNCNFAWQGADIADTDIKDGIILTLRFEVNAEAEIGDVYNIIISARNSDIVDKNLQIINIYPSSAKITVIDYTPGDVNDDGNISMLDTVLISRYIVDSCMYDPNGYAIHINEKAADVNDDGSISMLDTVLLSRYIVDGCKTDPNGYNIELKASTKKCEHDMQATEAKEATCTENGNIAYWYCSLCDKYFADSNGSRGIAVEDTVIESKGHSIITIPGYPAEPGKEGLTDGAKCSICGKVTKVQEVIPALEKKEYSIKYYPFSNDSYLQNVGVENENPLTYSCDSTLKLKNLKVEGYIFDGWYDAEGKSGQLVREISAGSIEDGETIELYAKWSLVKYSVQFDSPDLPVESVTYTVNTGVPLINPAKQFGYTFVGWSNDDGFLVSRVKPGTTGNITLHANWTSNRNKATSYAKYDKPIILEDDINGQFMFIYDIGKIDNVPLNQITYLGNSDGIEINQEYDVSNSVSKETAEKVANTVANATTKSSGWTLSDEWEKIYKAEDSTEEQKGKTAVRTDSEGNVTGGNYFVSNSSGGSSFVSNSSGGSNSSSSKVTTDNSYGINRSYDNSNEAYIDAKLGVSNTTTVGAEVGVDIPCTPVNVGASIENSTTVSAEVSGGLRNKNSVHVDDSSSSYIGTYNENNSSSYYNSTVENSSTWNSTSGYEKSYQTSRNSEISNAISEQISNKTSYSVTDATGGSKSTNASDTYTNSNSEEYSSSVRYNSEDKTTTKQSFKYSSTEQGYYRLVNVGTVHVFAVVTYDVATSSYYTFTYNVLDDERHIYTDFSLSDPNFNDCENGVVSFEIPYEVNEYVAGLTGKSVGLQFGLDGTVTKYTTTKTDTTVVVPQYYSANNTDNTYTAVKVSKISPTAFKGNTRIKTVVLPLYVNEIPDGAFEGCTNLETVIAYGVTKIGANAFNGCTKLKKFAIDNKVTSLGENAFCGVPEIMVNAANVNVAENAIGSGAKKVTLSIAKMEGSFDNKKVVISDDFDYFALYGNGSEIHNMQIESNAKETVVNNMILSDNKDTPLKLNSANVTINRVSINDAPGFAVILTKPETAIKLYSTNNLSSLSGNTVLCKNISFSLSNEEVASKLNVDGNILICGDITDGDELLNVSNGEIKHITEDEFNAYLTSSKVTFNANGGSAGTDSKMVYYGQTYGTMPVPTRANYGFDGWYTEPSGGTKVTESTVVTALVNQTLYAHWVANKFTLTYNANGGSVSPGSKAMTFGESYGTLPTPTRNYYSFDGWYTAASGGTKVSATTTPTSAADVTIYAHWTLKTEKGWVKASALPSGAQVTQRKYSYTLRSYTTSGSSSKSGWTKYDTKRTSWGSTQGPVYSNPSNGVRNVWSEQYVTSSNYKTVYKYFRYAVNYTGGYGSYAQSSSYPNYYEYIFDSQLETNGTSGGYTKGKYWYNGSNYISVYYLGTEQQWLSDNYGTRWYYQDPVYTYYYYKDENKESSSYPSGSDISNIQEWVMYREK